MRKEHFIPFSRLACSPDLFVFQLTQLILCIQIHRPLQQKYDYVDDEKAMAWDEAKKEVIKRKLVSYSESRVMADLPQVKRRKEESTVITRAAQAFNEQGWISGQLDLPPTGIKDAESVGLCSQVFNVASCQPKALEFALADPDESDAQFLPETAQRFLLSPGDMFCVPASNVYRIENHSKTHECKLFWTIVRPPPEPEQDPKALP